MYWDVLKNYEGLRANFLAIAQLKTLPPTGFQLCDKFKVEIYMARFNYENWSRLVKFVIDHAGPCLTGPMAQFNNMIGSEGQVCLYLEAVFQTKCVLILH